MGTRVQGKVGSRHFRSRKVSRTQIEGEAHGGQQWPISPEPLQVSVLAGGIATMGAECMPRHCRAGCSPFQRGHQHRAASWAELELGSGLSPAGTYCVIPGRSAAPSGPWCVHVPSAYPGLTLSSFLTPAEGRFPKSLLLTWPCSSCLLSTLLRPP